MTEQELIEARISQLLQTVATADDYVENWDKYASMIQSIRTLQIAADRQKKLLPKEQTWPRANERIYDDPPF